VPALTRAKRRPKGDIRSARLLRWSGVSPPAAMASTSSTSLVRSSRSGATDASNSVFATMPWPPGLQPVIREGVATRVSEGKTLRALAKRVPSAARAKRFGVAVASTMSGRSPSSATMITRVTAFGRSRAASASAPSRWTRRHRTGTGFGG
jgi:hypothetical protein